MSSTDHPIFKQFPLRGEVTLSTGQAPTPYQIYEGHGVVLLGYADASALTEVFEAQDVHPVLTANGKCILVLFICDFTKASHGPHNEFHVTVLSAQTPGQVISDDPAAALAALATRPDWGVLSVYLSNNSPEVVAYNTEYLGLDAHLAQGHLRPNATVVEFAFEDAQGVSLVHGKVRLNARSDTGLMWRVMRHLGLAGLWQAMRKKPAVAHVINRKSKGIPNNRRARTMTAPDKMIVTAFDPRMDRFEADAVPLAAWGFTPQIIEHLWPFRFVYLHPDAS